MSKTENSLSLSWCDRTWLPILNLTNVLNYFAERTNPFYDHTCNNEILRMRGIKIDALPELEKMQGTEYVLLHVQEPILYVIRKQKRLSPTATTPLANYYIIAGIVYQAPDLQSIIQSKMLTTIHCLQSAFEECFQYVRFHPSTDYYWNFSKEGSLSTSPNNAGEDRSAKDGSKSSSKEEISKKKEISIAEASDQARHMYRVDVLIHELVKKFPPKIASATNGEQQSNGASGGGGGSADNAENSNPNIKEEPTDDQNGIEAGNGPTEDDQKAQKRANTNHSSSNSNNNSSSNQLTPPAKRHKMG